MNLDNNTIIALVVVAALAYYFFVHKKQEKFLGLLPQLQPVIIYEHANFQGKAVALKPGKYRMGTLQLFGMPNDTISSIRIPPGFMVLAYEHDNFTGRSIALYESRNYIGNEWNDMISSLAVIPLTRSQWKNCTFKHDNAPGKHHDWCVKDFGEYSRHVDQVDNRAGNCGPKGHMGKGVCEVPSAGYIPTDADRRGPLTKGQGR